MKKHALTCILLGIFTVSLFSQTSSIRINQVGYEVNGPKTAIYQSDKDESGITSFKILNSSNQEVYSGSVTKADTVEEWKSTGPWGDTTFHFWTMDFSDFKEPGKYKVECNGQKSFEFTIGRDLYFPKCLAPQLDCFEKMRNKLEEDHNVRLQGSQTKIDLYGGYNEASGDASKHITHLQYANFMSTQETPILIWTLLRSYEINQKLIDSLNQKNQLFEEAAWGCDYMVKAQASEGYFYSTVFNQWDDTKERLVCAYEVIDLSSSTLDITDEYQTAFREGGGLCIAALAKAGEMGVSSNDNTAQDYLDAAKKAYDHIKSNNTSYCDDGKENIIDDFAALVAAIELYKATEDSKYKTDAGARVDKILDRQNSDGMFWADDAKNRPWFHASEEGMPIIAIIYYMEIDNSKDAAIKSAVEKAMDYYLNITKDTNNPFNYVRMTAKPYNPSTGQYGMKETMFFLPKDSNETKYWYQGENARLGSMATAILNAAQLLDDTWQLGTDDLSKLALDQINWILGKNPFEVCMFYGYGIGIGTKFNPPYKDGKNYVGGICNGITGALPYPLSTLKRGIEWAPAGGLSWTDWRWLEQWLPHEAWFFMATATLSSIVRGSQTGIIEGQNKKTVQMKPVTLKAITAGNSIKVTLSKKLNHTATIKLLDLKGRQVQSVKLNAGATSALIPGNNISSGVHILELNTGSKSVVRRKVQLF